MDQLALCAPDIGGERARRIERPAAVVYGARDPGDRLRAVDARGGAALGLLGEPGSLARLLHRDQARVDLLEQVALDDWKDRALLAVVARLRGGRKGKGKHEEGEARHRIALPLPRICPAQTKPIAP